MLVKLFCILGVFGLAVSAQAKNYDVDTSHSSVGFGVKHLVVSTVKGSFSEFKGTFSYDEKSKKIESASGEIKIASIDTNEKKRDDHLRGPDFFGIDPKNPNNPNNTIKFKLTKYTPTGSNEGKAIGDLTIKGITKPVELEVEIGGTVKDPWGNERMGFDAEGKINRKDFGITWNKALEAGGVVVGDEVKLEIHVEGIATAAKADKADTKDTTKKKPAKS